MSKSQGNGLMRDNESVMKEAAGLCGTLANPKRLQVMLLLAEHGEMSVGELARHVDLSQSALSQHLGKLRQAHVVSTRRDAQNIYYSTRHDGLRAVLACLERIYRQ